MSDARRVSVIIPVYNQVDLLARCLATLQAQQRVEVEVIAVDDASPEDPGPVVERFPGVRLIRSPRNVGYAEANNLGLREATGSYLLFLNSDTELPPDALARLVEYLEQHPHAGGVAPTQRGVGGELQRTCFRFPTLRNGLIWDSIIHRRRPDHPVIRDFTMADWDHQSERLVEHAITSCLLVRREVYDRLGGMDPELFLFYNDTDLCYRMHRGGYPIWYWPAVEILHHGSASIKTFERTDTQVYGDRYRYYRKWFGWRGAFALTAALWSRVGYEAVVELCHGQLGVAARKLRGGWRLQRAFGSRS